MKKKFLAVLVACAMTLSLAACGSDNSGTTAPASDGSQSTSGAETTAPSNNDAAGNETAAADPTNGEVVDGRFVETRQISVEVYDRGNDGGSDPTNNMYTQWIKDQMLELHNVEVEFVKVPRWTEVDEINNLLASGDAPDICLTYDFATIQTYANMGGGY